MAQTNTNPASAEDTQKTQILVVEDDLFLRNLLIKKLADEGYTVWNAVDGQEALKELETKRPHLIILDLLLPQIDGFEVLNRIKGNAEIAAIPVIILSNLGSSEDVQRAMRAGATDYLVKANFTLEEIVERIKIILQKKYFSVR